LVIIGGDLVDGRVDQLSEAVEPLDWIKSKHGVYFVTGKYFYFGGDSSAPIIVCLFYKNILLNFV